MILEQMVYALAALVALLFLYGYVKDKELHRRIRVIATELGNTQRAVHEAEIRLNEKFKKLSQEKPSMSEPEIETLVDITISEKLLHATSQIQNIHHEMQRFEEQFASRLIHLEGALKEVAMPRSSVGGADDQKILQLVAQGKDVEAIARELRISTAEVEFSLKLSDLR